MSVTPGFVNRPQRFTLTVRSAGIERWGAYTARERLHMGAAIFVAIFFALFVAIFSALIMSGKQWGAAEERARAPYG
jgi:hypothetical protein